MSGARSALISITVKNVRSYRDEAELSFDALRVGNDEVVQEFTTAASKPLRILPVAGIYGANASGKTGFLRAMSDMRSMVLRSFTPPERGFLLRRPFLLGPNNIWEDQPQSEFSLELLIDGVRWHYGFSVNDERILSEFAYHYPRGRPKLVFDRDKDEVQVGSQFKRVYKAIEAIIGSQALILSIVGALAPTDSILEIDEARLRDLHKWFTLNFRFLTADNRLPRLGLTADLAQEDPLRRRVLQFLRAADLGITDLRAEKLDDEIVERLKQAFSIVAPDADDGKLEIQDIVKLEHRGASKNQFFEPDDESTGTQVWVGLIGPAIEALDGGFVLLVDELDTSLHPYLVKRFVKIFQDPNTNPNCAQMIFNAHDTELLNDRERFALGRDQVWFTEKSKKGETRIFPLTNFKGRREDLIGKRYIDGRYGAVPSYSMEPTVERL